ncbi:MAG TPA: hypothetical protein PKJ37_02350 [Acidobacteriota bacterium]|nr:hypothetical protein [Acidobacteriota bacterium]
MLLVTLEILVLIVAPLLILYLTGRWPMRIAIPCLLVIPVLWYLTYSPIHELSHVLGAYMAGGSVSDIKLIPSFWKGEFGRAWITPQDLRAPWQRLVMTGSPYILDGLSVAAGFFALHRRLLTRPLVLGVAFMLLCLRPAFDLACETVAFALGGKGDLYHIAQVAGYPMVWLSMAILFGFSLLTIVRVLLGCRMKSEQSGNRGE